jgi:uncharacterized protein
MKLLVLLLVILGFVWWIRQQRPQGMNAKPNSQPTPDSPQSMLPCQQCGTHVPESDAVRGRLGPYCSSAHRQLAEG